MAETAYRNCKRPVVRGAGGAVQRSGAGVPDPRQGHWRGFEDASARLWTDGADRLSVGTVLFEMAPGRTGRAPLVLARAPGLCLSISDQTVTVEAQGMRADLACGVDSSGGECHVGMTWQSDRGRLTVAVWHGQGAVRIAELPWRGALDAKTLWESGAHRPSDGEGIAGLALSEAVEPLGPLGGIDPSSLVETPRGRRLASALVPGDMVLTADGDLAQVRWAGTVPMPAFPSRAPVRVRAPYLGLWRDLVVSPQDALRIEGTDVEYLFGTDAVLVPVSVIRRDAIVVAEPVWPYVGLTSIVLDRPATLIANGGAVQRLHGVGLSDVEDAPGYDARAVGLCGRIPVSLWPSTDGAERLPVLRREEMRMLLNFRAA